MKYIDRYQTKHWKLVAGEFFLSDANLGNMNRIIQKSGFSKGYVWVYFINYALNQKKTFEKNITWKSEKYFHLFRLILSNYQHFISWIILRWLPKELLLGFFQQGFYFVTADQPEQQNLESQSGKIADDRFFIRGWLHLVDSIGFSLLFSMEEFFKISAAIQ